MTGETGMSLAVARRKGHGYDDIIRVVPSVDNVSAFRCHRFSADDKMANNTGNPLQCPSAVVSVSR